ncbi:MAG: NAD(P)-dependent oxidoreductase [Candidatus Rokuibacteriota bacterium]|nr:MAG: NAD(P)-dependent oxidoreductase [Candidatus Rokubacteria bacterium]
MGGTTIGLVHPGEMGSAVGAALRVGGHRVVWASAGRSSATRARATADGLEEMTTLAALADSAPVIFSICPPHAARDVAREFVALGYRGLFVDANAVAPATARETGRRVAAAGARFVDGGIIGPPPRRPGLARLYLSGEGASTVAELFATSPLEAIVLDGPIGAASALKMAYAGWNKASQALLMAVRSLALHEGVDAALLAEWARSQPELPRRSEDAVRASTRKAWRFVGEMEEIAVTCAAAGLPVGFHEAAAEVYRRLAGWKDTPTAPSVGEVAKALAP